MRRIILIALLSGAAISGAHVRAWMSQTYQWDHRPRTWDILVTVHCDGDDAYDDGQKIAKAVAQARDIADHTQPTSDAAVQSVTGATVLLRLTGTECVYDQPIIRSVATDSYAWKYPRLLQDIDNSVADHKDRRTIDEVHAAQVRRTERRLDEQPAIYSLQVRPPGADRWP